MQIAPNLVAADSGADRALELGHSPDLVVGDMDSLSAAAHDRLDPESLYCVAEQDSVDFEKALCAFEAPGALAVGFTGGRSDHELATWHVLMRYPERRVVVIGREDVICLAPPQLAMKLPWGTRVSLFPMGEVRGRSEGLRWPIEGLEFAPGRCIGTSNEATGGPVRLEMDAPAMLLILPKAHLNALLAALI